MYLFYYDVIFFFPLKSKVDNNTPGAGRLNVPLGLYVGCLCPFLLLCRPSSSCGFCTKPALIVQTHSDLSVLYSHDFPGLTMEQFVLYCLVCYCFLGVSFINFTFYPVHLVQYSSHRFSFMNERFLLLDYQRSLLSKEMIL